MTLFLAAKYSLYYITAAFCWTVENRTREAMYHNVIEVLNFLHYEMKARQSLLVFSLWGLVAHCNSAA